MKREALRHPKMYDLADRLGCSRAEAIGYLTLLFDFAADQALAGNIGKWPDGAIARGCEWTGDSTEFVTALVDSRWLDRDDEYRLLIHDWAEHAQQWMKQKASKSKVQMICRTAVTPAVRPAVTTVEPTEPPLTHDPVVTASRDQTYTPQTSSLQTNTPPKPTFDVLFPPVGGDVMELSMRFLKDWNSTKGAAKCGLLPSDISCAGDLGMRVCEANWFERYPQALAKFPLKFYESQGSEMVVSTFVKEGGLQRVMEGNFDNPKFPAAGSTNFGATPNRIPTLAESRAARGK